VLELRQLSINLITFGR